MKMNVPEPKLDHLYQEVILDHNRNPRNFKEIHESSYSAHGHNPVCGDDYHLYFNLDENETIQDIGFKGAGCAISKASASILTTLVKGKTVHDANAIKERFLHFMTKDEITDEDRAKVDRLAMFEGVKEFPVRVKCATLIWRTLEDVVKQHQAKKQTVSYRMFDKGESMKEKKEEVQLSAEMTPNPNTVKFLVNRVFFESGSFDFPTKEKAQDSALAMRLFEIDSVSGVLIGSNFITVTKTPHSEWQIVAPSVAETIQTFLASDEPVISPTAIPSGTGNAGDSEIEQKIRTILDQEIRPAVARDGGDIIFYGYKDGTVTLHLQGSCSSCPSSIMTLKMGVENRLKQSIPEIREVVQV